MCTNKKWIVNKYTHKPLLVDCGKCMSCLMKKANKNASKIIFHQSPHYVPLFVHLTYHNACIPYIDKRDFQYYYNQIPIYRNSFNRRIRYKTNYDVKKHRVLKKHILGFVDKPEFGNIHDCCPMTNFGDDNCVSVFYLKDVQNFIKRLRSYVNYHKETLSLERTDFSYCYASEYGETYSRSHVHLLIYVPIRTLGDVETWKRAISSNWLYDDYRRCYKKMEVAKSAARYVATYINCSSYIAEILKCKQFKPRFGHSFRFGQGFEQFTFKKIIENVRNNFARFHYNIIGKNGVSAELNLPYPSYITARFFPKFKGFSRLSYDELFILYNDPSKLRRIASKLGYFDRTKDLIRDDSGMNLEFKSKILERTIKMLVNKRNDFLNLVKNLDDETKFMLPFPSSDTHHLYGAMCVYFFTQRQRGLNHYFYENMIDKSSIIQSYDNLDIINYDFGIPLDNEELDPNKFSNNVSKTLFLTQKFIDSDKSHKLKNHFHYD